MQLILQSVLALIVALSVFYIDQQYRDHRELKPRKVQRNRQTKAQCTSWMGVPPWGQMMDSWCNWNCIMDYCPPSYCACADGTASTTSSTTATDAEDDGDEYTESKTSCKRTSTLTVTVTPAAAAAAAANTTQYPTESAAEDSDPTEISSTISRSTTTATLDDVTSTTGVSSVSTASANLTSTKDDTAPTHVNANCVQRTYTDKMTSFDTTFWMPLDPSARSSVTYDKGFLHMPLSKSSQYITLQSLRTFSSGTATFEMRAKSAPGAVYSAILALSVSDSLVTPSDELDIEFVGTKTDGLNAVTWLKGKRLDYSIPIVKDVKDGFVTLEIIWNSEYIEWTESGKSVYKVKRGGPFSNTNGADIKSWISQDLRIRMGPWISESVGWAGQVDFDKYQYSMDVRRVSIKGCESAQSIALYG